MITIHYEFENCSGDFNIEDEMIAEAIADTFKRENSNAIRDNRESNSLELFIEDGLYTGALGKAFTNYWYDEIKDYWADEAENTILASLDDDTY